MDQRAILLVEIILRLSNRFVMAQPTAFSDDIDGYSGILQVDGYAGYTRLIAPDRVGPDIQLVYCWAHARRKLVEITRNGSAPIAEDGVKRIGELYRIEAELLGLDPQARLAGRQERSAPLVADMHIWLVHHRARVAAKSPLGEALAYIAKYWDGLKHFLTDGRIEIDNKTVECTIRPIALNRKNALFAATIQVPRTGQPSPRLSVRLPLSLIVIGRRNS